MRNFVTKSVAIFEIAFLVGSAHGQAAQNKATESVAANNAKNGTVQSAATAAQPALRLDIPHSFNPIDAYRASLVAAPNLANSPRIDQLIQNGELVLSLKDAISLALENNLDLAIARYNIPIAEADILRTKAGGSFRGVNTGVVQNTPGGGVGGFGSGSSGAGAGGTSGGAGGAGSGASGLVQSTLGTGTNVNSYDPTVTAQVNSEHQTAPLANQQTYGVPSLQTNTINGNFGYAQAFATGTTFSAYWDNSRTAQNSPYNILNPQLTSGYRVLVQQQLLAGFGLGPNLRYLRIAKNNQKISDEAFKLQVITTITQIANMYWDLVAAYDDEQVKTRLLDFATQTLESGRKQLELQAIPAMDVMKDEQEVASREQDVTIAKTTLQFQELLIKNALTKNLDDPILEAMPVRPTDRISDIAATNGPTEDLIATALRDRIELGESGIDLENRRISRDAARNALLPSLTATGFYAGNGLAGPVNPAQTTPSTAPVGFGGAVSNAFNNSAPDYYVGLSLNLPLRNRVAKSDQYRSELEARQAELRLQQLKKQIRIEVRNAQYALTQSVARVTSARKARDLAEKTFTIMGKEQELGAGSQFQTLTARRDFAAAESALVAAMTAYQKAKIELDRAVGATLEQNAIAIDSAKTGVVQAKN
ncbi:Outer membrane protein TolC [Granulicella pectinivorans]|uniref:Outer membrane protein TolC n=1 Tax=Granulicella pectinivorans TaxID=474950 RepID=A0A1I6MXX1_9BACT|nr:Outer membrane protein TolC [Granulicella pectinivorans]